ncbi:siderophore ABC transporter substrate-binding protein [Pseudooceanicola sp. 200-1SW]|uniref:siderophore ABC transporter substrate-binding protein n=1 Tax=Pseudooceanicola sp. 200-1SW TaxID=3425949 RepID=UPI003D7FE98E
MTLFATVSARLLRPAALSAAALLAATAAQADPVSFETAQGAMELPAAPQTIVAYELASVDTLAALGHVPAGVPGPIYVPHIAEQAADAQTVGTLFEPDFEAVAAMQPDLVVVGLRSLKQKDALERIAPVADMSVGPDAVTDGLARLAAFGALLGEEDKAAELAAQVDTKLAAARAAVEATGGNALIVLTNGPKVSAYGIGSRFGWLHSQLGWPAAADEIDASSSHGEAISFEFIADVNPDTLIVVDRGAAIQSGDQNGLTTLDNELVHSTTAWKEGRVLFVPAAEMYISSGGVQSLMTVLDAITEGLSESAS